MRLTQWTDYTLRVLMYCAACQGREQPVTINEVAQSHGISRSDLTQNRARAGCRGPAGDHPGARRRHAADEARARDHAGAVVRSTETDFHLVDASTPAPTNVAGQPLPFARRAGAGHAAFWRRLTGATLADLDTPQPAAGRRRVRPPAALIPLHPSRTPRQPPPQGYALNGAARLACWPVWVGDGQAATACAQRRRRRIPISLV